MEAFERWISDAERRRERSGRPLVTLSYAQSLDGSLALRRGQPTAISGPESSRLTHRLRAAHQAILVGVGTVLSDNPHLTVRHVPGEHPQPVVLDSRLRTPLEANLLAQHPKPAWIAAVEGCDPNRLAALESAGSRVLLLPAGEGGVRLTALLDCLGELGVDSLMVEGGARVISSFLLQNLVDLVLLTIAPIFLGGLRVLENDGPWSDPVGLVKLPHRLQDVGTARFGDDLVVWGRLDR